MKKNMPSITYRTHVGVIRPGIERIKFKDYSNVP